MQGRSFLPELVFQPNRTTKVNRNKIWNMAALLDNIFQTIHIRKIIPQKSVKPTRFMMPRSSNVENPQPQVNEEQSAKSVDEEIESDDSNFVSSHQVSHVHKGNPPPSSLRNSKFEIGGSSSRTRAKVTGCTTTNIHAKVNVDNHSPRNAPFSPIPRKFFQKGDSSKVKSTSTPILV